MFYSTAYLLTLAGASLANPYLHIRQEQPSLPPVPSATQVDQESVINVLATAIPASFLELAATNPAAASSSLVSQFMAGETPDWFQSLPSQIRSLVTATDAPEDIATPVSGVNSGAGSIPAPVVNTPAIPTGAVSSPAGSSETNSAPIAPGPSISTLPGAAPSHSHPPGSSTSMQSSAPAAGSSSSDTNVPATSANANSRTDSASLAIDASTAATGTEFSTDRTIETSSTPTFSTSTSTSTSLSSSASLSTPGFGILAGLAVLFSSISLF